MAASSAAAQESMISPNCDAGRKYYPIEFIEKKGGRTYFSACRSRDDDCQYEMEVIDLSKIGIDLSKIDIVDHFMCKKKDGGQVLVIVSLVLPESGEDAKILELPVELQMMITSGLSVRDILNFCATSKENQQFCESEDLWRNLVKRDHPGKMDDIPERMSWKEYYKYVSLAGLEGVTTTAYNFPEAFTRAIKEENTGAIRKLITAAEREGWSICNLLWYRIITAGIRTGDERLLEQLLGRNINITRLPFSNQLPDLLREKLLESFNPGTFRYRTLGIHLPNPSDLVNQTREFPGALPTLEAMLAEVPGLVNLDRRGGKTLLMTAALRSNAISTEETVKMLIDAGADPNLQATGSSAGKTALMFAADFSNTTSTEETVRLLIEAGTDLNLQNQKGRTVLLLAAKDSNSTSTEETVRMLIEAGADLNLEDLAGTTPLIQAASHSSTTSSDGTVKILIDAGADLNIQDGDGYTALMNAAMFSNLGTAATAHPTYTTGAEKTVKLLINAGADLNLRDYHEGETALDMATTSMVRYLLEEAMEPDKLWHAIMGAVISRDYEKVRTLGEMGALLERGEDTLLGVAVEYSNDPKLIRLLGELGADPNYNEDDAWPPIFFASYPETAEALIEIGADPNFRIERGMTPLHNIITAGDTEDLHTLQARIETIRVLHSRGADVNAKDDEGRTPLAYLLVSGYEPNPEIVKALLDFGAIVTPEMIARPWRTPNPEIKQLLETYGKT